MSSLTDVLHRIISALEVADAHKAELHAALDDATSAVSETETVVKSEESPTTEA